MSISAAQVKELRDRTNAGMMECKNALMESNGDIEKAIENMRKAGSLKAAKRAARVAAEGTIVVAASPDAKFAVLLEINSETDFVSREARFQQFAKSTGEMLVQGRLKEIADVQSKTDNERLELVASLGENISLRRLAVKESKEGVIGAYAHGDANGVRIGALVVLKKGSLELARDLAMQVAAMNPEFLRAEDIPAERLAKEKEIGIAQAIEEGKPEAMLEKIVAGKLKKFSNDATLLGQAYVKDADKTVEALLKAEGAEIESFVRFEVGEGIEKKQGNFAEEVMAQVKGS